MGTESFRRHARACVDAAIHRGFLACRDAAEQAMFDRIVRVVRARAPDVRVQRSLDGAVAHVRAVHNMASFAVELGLERAPEAWGGSRGHPLCVIASLAAHLFGRYPTPRFLASAWFGAPDRVERRRWFVAHARGQRFRSLALPIAMTRKMEHLFLRTPDHISVEPALRRAEVLGLGGTPELAEVILATPLVERFDEPERWRRALAWLARCERLDLVQVRPLVDYLFANPIELEGRTFASVMRLVTAWHGWVGRQRANLVAWPRSRWRGMAVEVEPTTPGERPAEWSLIELVDSGELAREGRALHHCVATYAWACERRRCSIWSLRYRRPDEGFGRPVLTIEVRPDTGTIVQVRGKANSRPTGKRIELVRQWAAREGLRFSPLVRIADGA